MTLSIYPTTPYKPLYRGTFQKLFLLLFPLLFLGGCSDKKNAEKTDATAERQSSLPFVEVDKIRRVGHEYSVVGHGFIAPADQIDLVSEVSGIVESVSPSLKPGGRLSKGDMVVQIEQRTYAAERDRAAAALESAQTAKRKAKLALDRQKSLAKQNLTSDASRDQAIIALASATAQQKEATALLTLADERLEDTVIMVPFDAGIISDHVTVGTYVQPGALIARIFDATQAEITVGLGAEKASGVLQAMRRDKSNALPVDVQLGQLGNSHELNGYVDSMSPALDASARTLDLIVAIPNAFTSKQDKQIFIGDYAKVIFPAVSEQLIYAVDERALRQERFLFFLGKDNHLVKLNVTVVGREQDKALFIPGPKQDSGYVLENMQALLTSLPEEAAGLAVRTQSQ